MKCGLWSMFKWNDLKVMVIVDIEWIGKNGFEIWNQNNWNWVLLDQYLEYKCMINLNMTWTGHLNMTNEPCYNFEWTTNPSMINLLNLIALGFNKLVWANDMHEPKTYVIAIMTTPTKQKIKNMWCFEMNPYQRIRTINLSMSRTTHNRLDGSNESSIL